MPDFRYPNFCAVARAAEVVGSRWTLLVLRDLFLGPRRFSDLRATLPGVSTSVLSDRLAHLERHGVIARRELPPPAAATVYELTETGRAFQPVLSALTRWGLRFMTPMQPGDHFEPGWVAMGLTAVASRAPTPARRFELRVRTGPDSDPLVLHACGGPDGARVGPEAEPGATDAVVEGDAADLFALAAGMLSPADAVVSGRIRAAGDRAALDDLPALFDIQLNPLGTPS